MSKIIGIDLGTTNSAVALATTGGYDIIENIEGARTTPSVVAISKTGERLVGVTARRQAVTNPQNTIYGIKRFMGHRHDESEVQSDIKNAPFKVNSGSDGGIEVTLGDKNYRPEEVSAMILRKLKEDAEKKLGMTITEAVITVPAYFNDSQRKATENAGAIAGLTVKRIINEPTAAALAYYAGKKKQEKAVVFDFGGGTFDVSVVDVADDVIEVKATGGDSHLGGRDIDKSLIDYFLNKFKSEKGVDLSKDPLALQRIDEAVEKAKIELSTSQETEINIPFISVSNAGPEHLVEKISRAKLEELARPFVDKAFEITKQTIEQSPFSVNDIHEIIMVGGQTRMPLVQARVKEFFNKEPNRSINPDEVVAIGAAVQGAILSGDVKDVLLLDVIPLSLSIETLGGVATKLIERNTTLPTSNSQVFSTAADNQSSVEIHIIQGERALAVDNKSLGKFHLDGIEAAPRGIPQIEVTFDVDTNGVLTVSAKDKKTSKANSIRIEKNSNLSKEDIEKMKQDAEKYSAEDQKKKALIEAKNIAQQACYEAEQFTKTSTDEVIKKEIGDAVSSVGQVVTGEDVSAIEQATKTLGELLHKHKSMQPQTPPSQGEPTGDVRDTTAQ
ncbi:MAG: molecular chaperone DnaK [Alphaproteobacteria bacterium]|nr:molecular chaperone DnaK [Alphaproteobacteria bacterium]